MAKFRNFSFLLLFSLFFLAIVFLGGGDECAATQKSPVPQLPCFVLLND